jgi:hypothetical protein
MFASLADLATVIVAAMLIWWWAVTAGNPHGSIEPSSAELAYLRSGATLALVVQPGLVESGRRRIKLLEQTGGGNRAGASRCRPARPSHPFSVAIIGTVVSASAQPPCRW